MRKNPLLELRERWGLSLRDIALLLGISPQAYLHAERGSRRDITNYERKLKALGLLKEDENIAEDYQEWKKELLEQLQKEILEKTK